MLNKINEHLCLLLISLIFIIINSFVNFVVLGEMEKSMAEYIVTNELETEVEVVRRLKQMLDNEIQEISTMKRNVSRTLQEYTSLKRSYEVSFNHSYQLYYDLIQIIPLKSIF